MVRSYVRAALHAAGSVDFEELAARYEHLARPIRRAGRAYPAALDDVREPRLAAGAAPAVDPDLRRAGEAHLQDLAQRSPAMFDGVILALERIDGASIRAGRGSYFDMLATCDALAGDPTLRARAEELAGPDPLRSGSGRAAAVGLCVLALRAGAYSRRVFTIGRRSTDLALDPGRWHVVPSGTLDERGLDGTLRDELETEHGITDASELAGAARAIALGYDLTRLRPELALVLDLGEHPAPDPGPEFSELLEVELAPEALAAVWERLGPAELTPAAAFALAAAERELGSPQG